MARPIKNNMDYFPHDNKMRNDRKIKALRAKYGLEGYAVYNMLLETLCEAELLIIRWNETEIELPYSHLEALLYFIASRVHNPIGMANEFHAGNSWAAKYEHECVRLEQLNLRVDQGEDNTNFCRNGWI